MIDEASIEKALDYLRDTAEEVAQAAAQRLYLEEGRKRLKAILMQKHNDLPLSAQEREAYADEEYEKYLIGLKEAVYRHEKARALRTAAEAKIEAWRSMSANQRAMKI